MAARVGAAFIFAIETAMRAGEICAMRRGDIDLTARVVHLPTSKNGTARDVPLSSKAVEILRNVMSATSEDRVFAMSDATRDALFRKIKKEAAVEGLNFHDSRHEAITRLAKRLDVLDLARVVGHKQLNQLLTYYNPTAAELVSRLD